MSRRKSARDRVPDEESEGSAESVRHPDMKTKICQLTDIYETPKSAKTTDTLRTRSGRKITPTSRPQFMYDMDTSLKKMQEQNKRYRQSCGSSSNKKMNADAVESSNSNSVDAHDESEDVFEPNADVLFEESRDVAGENLYTFRTPKKRNGLALLVANTPKTPESSLAMAALSLNSPRTQKNSKTLSLSALSLNGPRTPNRREIPRLHLSTKTPLRDRNFVHKAVNKKLADGEESDEQESEATDDEDADFVASQSESESRDSSESDENACAQLTMKNKMLRNVRVNNQPIEITSSRSARLQRRNQLAEPEFMPQCDNYFSAVSNKKVKTSDHTLDRLKSSGLHNDDMFALLRTIELSDEHRIATTETIQEYSQYYAAWMLQLSKGYNIIVYGVGSKQCVLQKFCETYPHRPYVIVNGFFPTITVNEILNTIKTEIVTISANARTDHEVVDGISAVFQRSPNTHLFLVIHNIDGPMLRKTKDQHILSRLAKIRNIHLLTSVDHINAPLMWNQNTLSNFAFVWYDATTLLPYTHETAYENSMFLQNSGELNLAAMNNVFQSLTINARGIYMLLVKSQMKNKKDANFQGMSFKDLYHACRERFLVSSDLALRTQLIEFVDHNMAKMKRGIDGTEHVAIPIDAHVLQHFIEQQKD